MLHLKLLLHGLSYGLFRRSVIRWFRCAAAPTQQFFCAFYHRSYRTTAPIRLPVPMECQCYAASCPPCTYVRVNKSLDSLQAHGSIIMHHVIGKSSNCARKLCTSDYVSSSSSLSPSCVCVFA